VGRRDTITESGPVALAEIDRLDELVGDLLLLARLDEGGRADDDEVDLDDVVGSQIAAVGRERPTVDASAVDPVRLLGDRRALTGMVRNLVDNAVRHARHRVVVTLTERAGTIRLVVDDDGPGVPAEQRDRIFDRFARIDDARTRHGGGTGLGLAVAAATARAHGGTIRVEEADGGGARGVVELPAHG
jgi:signal transduction histidine kinase